MNDSGEKLIFDAHQWTGDFFDHWDCETESGQRFYISGLHCKICGHTCVVWQGGPNDGRTIEGLTLDKFGLAESDQHAQEQATGPKPCLQTTLWNQATA